MSRTERKCMLGSAAVHGLLLLILLIGPAFISNRSRPAPTETPILYAIPANAIMTDGATRGGGNPNAKPPAPAPVRQPDPKPPEPVQQPVQQPTPQPVQKPEPVEPEPAPVPAPRPPKPAPVTKPAPAEMLTSKSPTGAGKPATKPQIKVADKIVRRTTAEPAATSDDAEERKRRAEAERKAAAAAARARADKLLAVARNIDRATEGAADELGRNLSGGTEVDIPGPGGAAFVNYGQFVQTAYYRAWLVPDAVENDAKTVVARVVVGRDGRVVSQNLVERSGNRALDRSVEDALDRVRLQGLPAFPAETKDLQRTFKIHFNLQTKRNFG